jgi:hypothetical protein
LKSVRQYNRNNFKFSGESNNIYGGIEWQLKTKARF